MSSLPDLSILLQDYLPQPLRVANYLSSKSSVQSANLFQEAKEAKLLEEAMTTVPEMDDDDSPPVDPSQLQGMTLQELKQHRRLLKKGLKVRL